MKVRRNWFKRFLAVGFGVAVLFGTPGLDAIGIGTQSTSVVHAAESTTVSRTSIHDGAILHAFCWNFNTIKENMADIAAAGYTAVQTSPINECLSTNPALEIHGKGMWYYHYQPTDWKIGNYQLGSRDEFIEMCAEAHKYGIGVIVDILPNHTTPTKNQVSQDLINAAGGTWDDLLHKSISNTSGRIGTTYTYSGLLDVDTENEGFQQYFYEFLMDCLACGADGFRIDTAKHIALPDDPVPDEYEDKDRNQFYPNMKTAIDENGVNSAGEEVDYADLFVYGETLQGNERTAAYQAMLGGTTASNYGASIRTALSSKDFSVSQISGYRISNEGDYIADSNKLVTWVESHDNYCNDGEDSWKIVNDEDVRLGWAIIGARADGTPLFFSRPMNSSAENPWGDNVLGAAGNDEYKSPEVVAVNHFRTAMSGKGEYLSNPGGNVQTIMIERGSNIDVAAEGAVIVNGSTAAVVLDSESKLADGTYVNMVSDDDSVFTVKDGVINGVLPARSVVVLAEVSDVEATTVFFYNVNNWSDVKAEVDGVIYDAVNNGDGWWSVTIPATTFDIVFTDGAGNTSDVFSITPDSGRYVTGGLSGIYFSKAEAEEAIGVQVVSVYFFNTENWDGVNAYAYLADGTQLFGAWPGNATAYDGAFWYRADVKFVTVQDFTIIFNYDGTQTENIAITAADLVESEDGTLNAYVALDQQQGSGNLTATVYDSMDAPEDVWGVSGRRNFSTVYFYNADEWDQVCVYTWGDVNLGEWPGKAAEEEGDGWYKLRLDAAPSSNLNIIFNNGDNGEQTGNLVVDDIQKRYFVGKAGKKYASKDAAMEAIGDPSVGATTRLYFYNEEGWDTIYAYAWGGGYDNGFGSWPGVTLTEDADGWYYADVPEETIAKNTEYLRVIFHNNSSDGTDRRVEQPVRDTQNVYFAKSIVEAFPSKAAVFTALGIEPTSTVVYFYNKDNWSNVYVWAWDSENNFTGGVWPGAAATKEADSDWWYFEVPKPAEEGFEIIFSNSGSPQTSNIAINDPAKVYTFNSANAYASREEVLAAAAAQEEEPQGSTTLYFYNNDGWDAVYAWAWDNNGNLFDGSWPGPVATDIGDGWWSVEVPKLAERGFTVIFNNGNGTQSADIGINSEENVYMYNSANTFSSKQAVLEALGISTTPVDEEPVEEEPVVEDPADEEPVVDEPIEDEPTEDETTVSSGDAQEPASGDNSGTISIGDDKTPTTGEISIDTPAEKPTVEEPATEETSQAPASDERETSGSSTSNGSTNQTTTPSTTSSTAPATTQQTSEAANAATSVVTAPAQRTVRVTAASPVAEDETAEEIAEEEVALAEEVDSVEEVVEEPQTTVEDTAEESNDDSKLIEDEEIPTASLEQKNGVGRVWFILIGAVAVAAVAGGAAYSVSLKKKGE